MPDARAATFVHPDNKRMTGPLPRFAQMVKESRTTTTLPFSTRIRAVSAETRPQRYAARCAAIRSASAAESCRRALLRS
jgi:hypothetical protein